MLPSFSRRRMLAAPFATAVASVAGCAAASAPPVPPGLQARARTRNRFFGAAIDPTLLGTSPAYMNRIAAECGIVVGETQFKWGALRPSPDAFNFAPADALANWAERRAIQLRGHTLLWHQSNPAWLTETLSPATGERLLATHIRTVCGHFRYRVAHWDVANEVLHVQDGKPGGWRESAWFRALGPRMLDVAFHACAATDPLPLRFLNEDQVEYAWDDHVRKRAAILEQVSALRRRGVPIQALGIQAHLEAGVRELDQNMLSQFIADLASMGLKVAITELDVRDNRLPADIPQRDAEVAAHTRAFLDAVLPHPAVLGVLTWGLADNRTWLNDDLPRADKLPQRALPLDADLRRKPMYEAIGAAFDATPMR